MKRIFTLFSACFFVLSLTNAQDKAACLEFDGAGDKVVVTHDASLNLGRSAFTIEAWIAASGNMVTNMVLAPTVISKKGATSPSTDGMLFGLTDQGKLALQLEGTSFTPGFGGGGGPGVSAVDLRDGVCHHIAWTREVGGVEDTVNAYQDAAYVKKTRLKAGLLDISNTQDLWFGASGFNTGPNVYGFEGQIKEIRIWDYARTESQIFADKNTHLVGNEAGLIFYWRMNENGASAKYGDTVYDCGPFGMDGIINGAQWANFVCDNLTAMQSPNNCVPDTTTTIPGGFSETESQDVVVVYPNPVKDEFRILTSDSKKINRVVIYDMNGRVVLQQSWNGMDALSISALDKGMYMIRLSKDSYPVYRGLLTKD